MRKTDNQCSIEPASTGFWIEILATLKGVEVLPLADQIRTSPLMFIQLGKVQAQAPALS